MVAGAVATVPILVVKYKNATTPDINSALSLSLILIIISAIIYLFFRSQTKNLRFTFGAIYADAEKRLSKYANAPVLLSIAFLFLIVLLPSFYFLRAMDMNFFADEITNAIWISMIVAFFATVVSIIFGLPFAFYIASKSFASDFFKLLNDMILLIPTVTIGLSLSLFWSTRFDEIIVLILAHVAMIFPYFVSSFSEMLQSRDINLPDVARTLGARPFYAFRTVTFALVLPAFISATIIAFMRSVAETGGTLAASKTISTIPILIMNLHNSANDGQAASAATLLLFVSVIIVFVLRNGQKVNK
jgi:ABC-type Fe3+ transport system permease subunit